MYCTIFEWKDKYYWPRLALVRYNFYRQWAFSEIVYMYIGNEIAKVFSFCYTTSMVHYYQTIKPNQQNISLPF